MWEQSFSLPLQKCSWVLHNVQIALPCSQLKRTILSRIVARCCHLAAGYHKDSCSFCWVFEEGVVLRASTVWIKLLKCHLKLLERHLLSPALSCGLSVCVEERLKMGWCGFFSLETLYKHLPGPPNTLRVFLRHLVLKLTSESDY